MARLRHSGPIPSGRFPPSAGTALSVAIEVVASFACGCAWIDLSFMDLSHGQAAVWRIEVALFALWGERGSAAAAVLLAPYVEEFHRWRYSPGG